MGNDSGLLETETAPGRSPDIIDALLGLWQSRILLLLTCAAGALLAIIYVARAPVIYTAQLTLTPSESSPSESASRLGSLASLAGVSSGSHVSSPFDLFLLALQSRQVATVVAHDEPMLKRLFPDRWDAARGRWLTATDRTGGFSIRRMLGLPVAPLGRPTAGEIDDLLSNRVGIGQSSERGTATILFEDPDPVFATHFIARITVAADDLVKARSLARSTEFVAYLRKKLGTVTLAEDREVLAAELGARERSAMLASSGLPFAADPLGEPTASTLPTSPRLALSLAIGIAGGFTAGLLVILLLHVRGRARNQRD